MMSERIDSLRSRAIARNVRFRISLRWPIHFMNPVEKNNLSIYKHDRGIELGSNQKNVQLQWSERELNPRPPRIWASLGYCTAIYDHELSKEQIQLISIATNL